MVIRRGDHVGDYVVEREIGRGGSSVVYRARHQDDGRVVAVKVLLPELVNQPHAVRRFLREVDAVRAVDHPNIVRLISSGLVSLGRPFLVLELLNGTSLASLVTRGRPMDTPSAVEIVQQAANALDAVHAADIVHRDISTANILLAVGPDGGVIVKLVDFGVAKLLGSAVFVSGDNLQIGAPSFRAPEQERESASASHRADIYALAVTTFFLLSGGLSPWGHGRLADVLGRKAFDPTPDLRAVCPHLSAEQAKVLRIAMEREPMKRWISAGEFAAALRAASNVSDAPGRLLDRLRDQVTRRSARPRSSPSTPTPSPHG